MKRVFLVFYIVCTASVLVIAGETPAPKNKVSKIVNGSLVKCYQECKKNESTDVCNKAIDDLQIPMKKMLDSASSGERVDSYHYASADALRIMDGICPKESENMKSALDK